jgi:hypothetical protein
MLNEMPEAGTGSGDRLAPPRLPIRHKAFAGEEGGQE